MSEVRGKKKKKKKKKKKDRLTKLLQM
jgi:hypothetical protein